LTFAPAAAAGRGPSGCRFADPPAAGWPG